MAYACRQGNSTPLGVDFNVKTCAGHRVVVAVCFGWPRRRRLRPDAWRGFPRKPCRLIVIQAVNGSALQTSKLYSSRAVCCAVVACRTRRQISTCAGAACAQGCKCMIGYAFGCRSDYAGRDTIGRVCRNVCIVRAAPDRTSPAETVRLNCAQPVKIRAIGPIPLRASEKPPCH